MRIQCAVRFFASIPGKLLEFLGFFLDAGLFFLVARNLIGVFGLLFRDAGERLGKFGQILLGAFPLVVRPLIGRIGLFEDHFILEKKRLVLGVPTLVTTDCTDGGKNGRKDSHILRESIAAAMRSMLDRVIVWSVNVKFSARHLSILLVNDVVDACLQKRPARMIFSKA